MGAGCGVITLRDFVFVEKYPGVYLRAFYMSAIRLLI